MMQVRLKAEDNEGRKREDNGRAFVARCQLGAQADEL